MTDRDLALSLLHAIETEREARSQWARCKADGDLAEADAAIVVVRLVTPLRRALELWMQDRAMRAALRQKTA